MRHQIREKIQQILQISSHQLSDDTLLISSGMMDSIQVVELASWIDEHFHCNFAQHGFNVYHLDSVNAILAYIQSHHT